MSDIFDKYVEKKIEEKFKTEDPAKIKEAELLAVLKNYAENASSKISAIPNSQAIMNQIGTAEGSIPALKESLEKAKTKEADAVNLAKTNADKALKAAKERVDAAVTKAHGQLTSANKALDLVKNLTTVEAIITKLGKKGFNKSVAVITGAKTNNPKITVNEAIKILEDRKGLAQIAFNTAKTTAELNEKIAELTQAVDDATAPFDQLNNNTYVYKTIEYTTAESALTNAQAGFKQLCIDNFPIVEVSFFKQLHDDAVNQGVDAVKDALNQDCLAPHAPQCSGEVKFNFDGVDYSCCVVN